MNFAMTHFRMTRFRRRVRAALLAGACLLVVGARPSWAQSPGALDRKIVETTAQDGQPLPQVPGTISGTVLDQSGAPVAGAQVKLTRDTQPVGEDATSDNDGQFSFTGIASGYFTLVVSSTGFASQSASG